MLHRLPVEWASKLLEDAEEVTDAAVETMTVCRPDRWADAEYQFIADQKAKDLAYDMENNGKGLIVSQRTDALIQLGCTGSVVWDAAVVLARCLEFWGRTGLVDLHGARVVELGAGCGLTGCVAAALGAHVLLTDQAERLSLLQHNVSLNAHLFRSPRNAESSQASKMSKRVKGKSKSATKGKVNVRSSLEEPKNPNSNSTEKGRLDTSMMGSAEACELDWESRDMSGFKPVDLVIATDCVFNELVVPMMIQAMRTLSESEPGDDTFAATEDTDYCRPTMVINCMEMRCAEVHEVFLEEALQYFQVFRLPESSFHPKYTHPRIVVYVMKLIE